MEGAEGWNRLEHALRFAPKIAEELERKLQHFVEVAPEVAGVEELVGDLAPEEFRERFEAAHGQAANAALAQALPDFLITDLMTLPLDSQERLVELRFVIAATEHGDTLATLDGVLEHAALAGGTLLEAERRFAILMETSTYGLVAVLLLEEWLGDLFAPPEQPG